MKFVLLSSLEHMALVKIVVSLWNQSDIRDLILLAKLRSISDFLSTNEKWKKIEDRVIEKVLQLPLPQLLKEKVLGVIKPIGLQILEWMKFHCSYFDLLLNLPAELCWTSHGAVDRKKTAEILVRNENLDISTRYKLACIYCLEDNITKVWNSMPEDLKESDWDKFAIISFWSHNMKRKDLVNAHISYKDEFDQCADMGNKEGAEYFLEKLTPMERDESLVEVAKSVEDAHTLCFLLSKMDEEQQMEVFKNGPCEVLECFLQWPLQSFFIGVANCMWDFLFKCDYESTLIDIVLKVKNGYKDFNYRKLFRDRKLFRELWQKSPNALKSFITDQLDQGYLLTFLLDVKDKENIRLIFKDTTSVAKEKLIYSDKMNTLCESFICANEWEFLEFFIREWLPSKNSMLKFKEDFERFMIFSSSTEHFETMKHKWEEIFLFPDESICKYGKRSVEEGESSSSKRFHSLE